MLYAGGHFVIFSGLPRHVIVCLICVLLFFRVLHEQEVYEWLKGFDRCVCVCVCLCVVLLFFRVRHEQEVYEWLKGFDRCVCVCVCVCVGRSSQGDLPQG